jgi:hypothetical protein
MIVYMFQNDPLMYELVNGVCMPLSLASVEKAKEAKLLKKLIVRRVRL